MLIMPNGISYSTCQPLFEPTDDLAFLKEMKEPLTHIGAELQVLRPAAALGSTLRNELQRRRTVDLGDPIAAGWTYLVNARDPQLPEIRRIIKPLAERRNMDNPDKPLLFHDELLSEWFVWLVQNRTALDFRRVPRYILIVGGPDQVPFHFQAFLSTSASVGRVGFDSLDDLQTYVEKLLRLEAAIDPVVQRNTIFFAPVLPDRDDQPDATYFSRHFMAGPLAAHVSTQFGLQTHLLFDAAATKQNLLKTINETKPALVYTASHGMVAYDQDLETQKRVNGAVCCLGSSKEPLENWVLTADDVPKDEPFLDGSVLFQFACHGYGTPARSDFAHLVSSIRQLNGGQDFISALPKRLLAHPHGPIAYVGHVDVAVLRGFHDPDGFDIDSRAALQDSWDERIDPFLQAVDKLLSVDPVGLAMQEMAENYESASAIVAANFDLRQRGSFQMTDGDDLNMLDTFIMRNDAQNYMILGDPAAHLRIPE